MINKNNNFQPRQNYAPKEHPPKVTAKGTELPMLDMRGKPYLQVAHRLVWFREDHPDWSIETELLSVTDKSAYAKATIKDNQGRIIATSHKFENIAGFADFIEKAETGSIGRALALVGYGTQFAPELDEEDRLADAPVQPAKKDQDQEPEQEQKDPEPETQPADPQNYVIPFGRKYKGKKLGEIPKAEMENYIKWLETSDVRPETELSQQLTFLKSAFAMLHAPVQEPATPAEKPKNHAPQTQDEATDLQKKMHDQKLARAILTKDILAAQQDAGLSKEGMAELVKGLFKKSTKDLTLDEMNLLKVKILELSEATEEIA